MFRLIKRTDGVSTTDLLGRMLLMTRSHLQLDEEVTKDGALTRSEGAE